VTGGKKAILRCEESLKGLYSTMNGKKSDGAASAVLPRNKEQLPAAAEHEEKATSGNAHRERKQK